MESDVSSKYRMRFFAIIILLGSGNPSAFGSIGADMLRMDVPANSAALAAGAANSGGSEMLAWNPAGILGQTMPSCSFTHFFSLADTAYEQLEGLYPQWLNGSCAFRIFYASTYNFVERDLQGNDRGTVNNHDLLLHLAYARAWDPAWTIGAALKLFESVLAEYDSQGFGIDLGAQYKLPRFPSLVLGLALQNIGLMNAWDTSADSLPLLAVFGAAFTLPLLSEHQVKLLLDINQLLAGAKAPLVSLGLEYNLKNILCLRSGYRLENELGTLSLGAGISYANFGLDYAFQPFGILGNNHRFTLSFYLRPAAPASASARKLQPPGLKSAKLEPSEKGLKKLRVASRNIENIIKFKLPPVNPDIRGWNFEVRDCDGRVVKKMHGLHTPPKELLYDGLDQDGNPLPRGDKYQFVFTAAGKKIFTRETPQLEPVKKLYFKDRAVLAPEVRFKFQTRPLVKAWALSIQEKRSGKPVKLISGTGELPENIIWDGKTVKGIFSDTHLEYQYALNVTYPDGLEVSISENIQPILARQKKTPEGKSALLITSILFDFDSAVLKPEMVDKILMAQEIIKRRPDKVKVICEGHADDVGSAEYNLTLSQKRAQMVAQFLARQADLSEDSISIQGFGMTRPEKEPPAKKARINHRRVEIRLIFSDPQPGSKK